METTDLTMFLVVKSEHGQHVHGLLKNEGWLEAEVETRRSDDGTIGFPLASLCPVEGVISWLNSTSSLEGVVEMHQGVRRPTVDPHRRLHKAIQTWLDKNGLALEAITLAPAKWEKLGDLALLPRQVSTTEAWKTARSHEHAESLWGAMAAALNVSAIGVQAPIADDTFRSSQVEMLLGPSEVCFTDHGMTYTFDAAKVMFSSGNITERRRIGNLDMSGEVVVDAYAGVGYYTFPMLVHAGAAHVHACEINPASLAGLKAGAEANGIRHQMTVHEGDNTVSLASLQGIADRCHLGLLPSSEAVWEASLLALKPTGGVLHIHMNVEEENIDDWVKDTVVRFEQMSQHHQRSFNAEVLHLERVKWFAPWVRHVVLDLRLRP
ncbi:MAG: hypothetical protein DWC03_05780 [Candidatus Poseidoniales archaeon]|nr:MAG: hypothetical protein DWC03_05780 [Candidatus Poseidoniales archaeon]